MGKARKWRSYPALGSTHKNGDRIYGYASGYAAELAEAGTPIVSSLRRATIVHPVVRTVDIDDVLQVVFDGARWTVFKGGNVVGNLTWSFSQPDQLEGRPNFEAPMSGMIVVERVFISDTNEVVNLGGKFIPESNLARQSKAPASSTIFRRLLGGFVRAERN